MCTGEYLCAVQLLRVLVQCVGANAGRKAQQTEKQEHLSG